jgi:hypothetical protein
MLLRKYVLLLALLVPMARAANAQATYPAKWRYNLKRTATKEYQLVFHLELERGWHIRAHNDKGDTLMMTPVFTFTPNSDLELKGEIKPQGMLDVVKVDSLGVLEVYSYNVLYTKTLAAKAGTKISGRYTYQVCDNSHCLAPKTEKFAFIMKE